MIIRKLYKNAVHYVGLGVAIYHVFTKPISNKTHDSLNKQLVLLLLLLLAFTTHLRILASSFLRFRDHTQ